MKKELEAAIEAAKCSGEILMEHYGKVSPELKGDNSLLTEVDILSEAKIKTMLAREFPDYGFRGEESERQDGAVYTWVVDPLDGTTNYVSQVPFFNISIALAKKGEVEIGVVYFPIRDELFYAERGNGAYLNGKGISASDTKEFTRAVIGFCHGRSPKDVDKATEVYRKIKSRNSKLRQFGAGALELCYVASGRLDAFYMGGVSPWDVAAGTLIASEGGCTVSEFSGRQFTIDSGTVLAANEFLFEEIRGYLQDWDV